MRLWGNNPITYCTTCLDQPGDPGGGTKMADIGLDRSQRTETNTPSMLHPGLSQRTNFNRITQLSAGTMSFYITDIVYADIRNSQRIGNNASLPADTGSGIPDFVITVVVNSTAEDHSVDSITISKRILKALESNNGNTGTVDRAISIH
ncbi:Uncharacterised protein [Serratia marcescens]|nr:Uncharacterised protein [Serratia marcescens]CAI0738805.1 Uncharacterised protein [Serratia marcescens]